MTDKIVGTDWQQNHTQVIRQQQTSSSVHISSSVCPEGMSNLRPLWLAGRGKGWREGKGEGNVGRGRESADSDTISLYAANTGTN